MSEFVKLNCRVMIDWFMNLSSTSLQSYYNYNSLIKDEFCLKLYLLSFMKFPSINIVNVLCFHTYSKILLQFLRFRRINCVCVCFTHCSFVRNSLWIIGPTCTEKYAVYHWNKAMLKWPSNNSSDFVLHWYKYKSNIHLVFVVLCFHVNLQNQLFFSLWK